MAGKIQSFLLAGMLLAGGSGLARAREAPCPLPGQTMMLLTRLYFGQDRDGRPLAAGQWEDFLARSVSPRFPGGFTVYDAKGQWQDARTGAVAREATKVVEIAAPDSPAARRRIAELASLYKARFHQQSVGIVSASACAAF